MAQSQVRIVARNPSVDEKAVRSNSMVKRRCVIRRLLLVQFFIHREVQVSSQIVSVLLSLG